MRIEKIHAEKLKKLENSVIWEERSPMPIPFVVVNGNSEILLGANSVDFNTDADGMIECIVIDEVDNDKSRQIEFALHYIGMSAMVHYKNFNTMPCPHSAFKDLYLWNIAQFEACAKREAMMASLDSEDALF